MKRLILILLLSVITGKAYPSQIDKGYAALRIYDYFKAKAIFYKQLKKHPAEAAYGLATIYFRNDNPFHQLDSAYKYISICKGNFYKLSPENKTTLHKSFSLNDSAIATLHDSISLKAYNKLMRKPDVAGTEKYLSIYFQSKFNKKVTCLRDSFIFFDPERKLTVAFFTNYIYSYPQSCYLSDARNLLEFAIYMETTADKNDKAYLTYLEKYPKGKYVSYAKEELINYQVKAHNAPGIYSFIRSYGATYPVSFAWNMLLGIEAPHRTKTELQNFLEKYSDYPKKNEIEEEFVYWNTPFFLTKQNDKMGFCDSAGKIKIENIYNDAEGFSEGYAAVQKNELYGYINKAGKTKIEFQYTEAASFSNNTAIVQKDKKYFLIDYSNKVLSARYDDIADFSEGMAIVKKNNQYGAINQNGEEIINPSFDIISDFSEGFAVFLKNGKYGFLDKQGFVAIAPLYDWVSSFKNGQSRAQLNKNFGVINKKGEFIIEPTYELINEINEGMYVVVKNGLYGFIDSTGCIQSEIKYSYNPSLKPAELTDGKFMRLILPKKQDLQSINGYKFFGDQSLDEVQLPVNGLTVIKEKNKYELYSLTRNTFVKKSIPSIYSDGKYWYLQSKKGISVYDINLRHVLFMLDADKIYNFEKNYFLLETEDGKGLSDKDGAEILSPEYDEIRTTSLQNLLYVERNEKGAYFNVSARNFIWKEEGF